MIAHFTKDCCAIGITCPISATNKHAAQESVFELNNTNWVIDRDPVDFREESPSAFAASTLAKFAAKKTGQIH